jgi:hypothetical protein
MGNETHGDADDAQKTQQRYLSLRQRNVGWNSTLVSVTRQLSSILSRVTAFLAVPGTDFTGSTALLLSDCDTACDGSLNGYFSSRL